MDKEWDGAAFRKLMANSSRDAEHYANVHKSRLTRGQGNGKESMHDRSLGEHFACEHFVVSSRTESASELLNYVDELSSFEVSSSLGYFDKGNFMQGFQTKLQEIRKMAQGYPSNSS